MSDSADAPNDVLILEGRAAYATRAVELVRGARQELLLRSDALEFALYGSDAFADSLKQFLLGSETRPACACWCCNRKAALRNALQLIELGRRLSSRVGIPRTHARAGRHRPLRMAHRRPPWPARTAGAGGAASAVLGAGAAPRQDPRRRLRQAVVERGPSRRRNCAT